MILLLQLQIKRTNGRKTIALYRNRIGLAHDGNMNEGLFIYFQSSSSSYIYYYIVQHYIVHTLVSSFTTAPMSLFHPIAQHCIHFRRRFLSRLGLPVPYVRPSMCIMGSNGSLAVVVLVLRWYTYTFIVYSPAPPSVPPYIVSVPLGVSCSKKKWKRARDYGLSSIKQQHNGPVWKPK